MGTYAELAAHCRRKKYRLLLRCDRDHVRIASDYKPISNALEYLEIKDGDEPLVRVRMTEHTRETAALVALAALERMEKDRRG